VVLHWSSSRLKNSFSYLYIGALDNVEDKTCIMDAWAMHSVAQFRTCLAKCSEVTVGMWVSLMPFKVLIFNFFVFQVTLDTLPWQTQTGKNTWGSAQY
jgi:hypothetical protein